MGYGFNMGFGIFEVMFVVIVIIIIAIFISTFVRSISQWHHNNESPRLTVDATVVTKRADVSYHHHTKGAATHYTTYYVTFEVESGDRIELNVGDSEYGMLVEGDRGKLSFQGTRYLEFKRIY